MNRKFNSFKEFYPFYLSEHKNSMCRLLHFVGTLLVLLTAVFSSIYNLKFLFLAPFFGYGFDVILGQTPLFFECDFDVF